MSGHKPLLISRDHDLQELSEAELRHLYDEEEIERFISLFSTYVTEIRLSTSPAGAPSTGPNIVDNMDTTTRRPSTPCPADRSLSEHVACNYLLPHLPPAAAVAPAFTLKRLSLTTQRLYLAMFPQYKAFLSDLAQLALWKDYPRSLRHCILFWFLWFHDLLLTALVFRITFGLLRRRLSNYPTLGELQERRQEAAQALKFGEAVQQSLSVTTLGPLELWRLLKLYKSESNSKANPVSQDTIETNEEENLKRDMLQALNELADLHERIKNIFTWRRPDVSRRYLLFFIFVGLGTLVLPAKYVAKVVYWFGGILFWHVTPVVAALPRGDRKRVSMLCRDAPTDSDYAMELIAKRIATGQDVGTGSLRNQSRRASSASASTGNLTPASCGNCHAAQPSEHDGTNWKKWSERIAQGKLLLEEGRQFLSVHNLRNPTSGETIASSRDIGVAYEHTFLAQYASSPGLITLTPSTLFFTPITATHARLVVPRDRLRGARRSGLMKGIIITWAPEGVESGEEREEKFHWVGSRDELFARLIGPDGTRWLTI